MEVNPKLKLPNELLSELIKFIPFNLKWIRIRISKVFDYFLLKFQQNYLIYLIKLRNKLIKKNKKIIKTLEEKADIESETHIIVMLSLCVNLDILYFKFKFIMKSLASKAKKFENKINQKEYLWPEQLSFDDDELVTNECLIHFKELCVKRRQILLELYSFCLEEIKQAKQPRELDRIEISLMGVSSQLKGIKNSSS